jgi:aminoglycoside phosphotransferase (APT) family kinase protein
MTRQVSCVSAMTQQTIDPTFRSRLVKAFAKGITIEDLNIRPMRRRPGSRHVFSCDLIVADRGTRKQNLIELIGKRDTTQGTGKAAREYEAMRLLWDSGFSSNGPYRIPWPVQHFPDLRFLLQGKARGSKLRSYLGRGNDASRGYVRMTGLWLAKLHNLTISPPQVCNYENEIASLRMFVAAVSAEQPKLAVELERRAAIAEQAFASFQGVPATMVHGDFHPDHIFVEKDFVTVIDFERFCIADPARDLGSFIAHMHTMACLSGRSLHAANKEAEAFLGSYFSVVPSIQRTAIAPRIAPYVALAGLEALYYVASVLKVVDSGRIAMYVKCMQESELWLSGSAVSRVSMRAAG